MTAMTENEIFEGGKPLGTPAGLIAVLAISALMLAWCVWLVFMETSIESSMGIIQKVFYFHVPSAFNMFLGVAIGAIGSVAYLITKREKWDRLGDAGVELSIVFGLMVIISGPLWARKAWGTYWVWDVRLTTSLVLVLTMIACKIVRGYAGQQSRTIAAGLAVFGAINSLFVYYSVNIWKTQHPTTQTKWNLDPDMKRTFWTCVATFLIAFVGLIWLRLRMGKLESALDRIHMKATEAGLHD